MGLILGPCFRQPTRPTLRRRRQRCSTCICTSRRSIDRPHSVHLVIPDADKDSSCTSSSAVSMTDDDDGHIVAFRGASRRLIRGLLHIVNPSSDTDKDDAHAPSKHGWNPLPSPISRSPYSEYSSLPSTSYTPRNIAMPRHHQTSSVEDAPYVPPSLPSPSSSSSPAVEPTPPPSTPGTLLNRSTDFEENIHASEDGLDPRQQAAGRPTYVLDGNKQNIPPCLQPAKPLSSSRPATVRSHSNLPFISFHSHLHTVPYVLYELVPFIADVSKQLLA